MQPIIEARMLLKIKDVRRDSGEFYGPPDFIILLNSKKFQIALRGGEEPDFFLLRSKPECY
jgi:hypothetical protein